MNGDEEEYVVIELPDIQGLTGNASTDYQMIGFDTETPFLRVGRLVLKGEWRTTLGTNLILTTSAEIKARSQRTLSFRLVELVEKQPSFDNYGGESTRERHAAEAVEAVNR